MYIDSKSLNSNWMEIMYRNKIIRDMSPQQIMILFLVQRGYVS